jgi:hypothetical protein
MAEDQTRGAEAAERELADMEERSERVGEHIDEARKDWQAKVADDAVPGASGDPDRAEEGGRHPETAYPAKGPDDEVSGSDSSDNDRGVDDTPEGAAREDESPDDEPAAPEDESRDDEAAARDDGSR